MYVVASGEPLRSQGQEISIGLIWTLQNSDQVCRGMWSRGSWLEKVRDGAVQCYQSAF